MSSTGPTLQLYIRHERRVDSAEAREHEPHLVQGIDARDGGRRPRRGPG